MRVSMCFILIILLITITTACSVYQTKSADVPVSTDEPVGTDELVVIDESVNVLEPVSSSQETIHTVHTVTGLSRDTSPGFGYFIDYSDEDVVIFHVEFGLFVYNLEHETIVLSVDFEKTFETIHLQGDGFPIRVVISEDGTLIQLSNGPRPPYFIISTSDGTYAVEGYWTILTIYKPNEQQGELFSLNSEGAVGTIEQLCFRRGENIFVLFANWDFQ